MPCFQYRCFDGLCGRCMPSVERRVKWVARPRLMRGQIEMVRLRHKIRQTPSIKRSWFCVQLAPSQFSPLLLASLHALPKKCRGKCCPAVRVSDLGFQGGSVRLSRVRRWPEVTLNTPNGTLIVPKVNVLRMTDSPVGTMEMQVETTSRGQKGCWKDRALQATRYFFAPSAHTLKSGEGYASASPYTGGNISYGVSDNFIAGLSASFLGAGFTFKAGAELADGVNVSAGALYNLGDGGTVSFICQPHLGR